MNTKYNVGDVFQNVVYCGTRHDGAYFILTEFHEDTFLAEWEFGSRESMSEDSLRTSVDLGNYSYLGNSEEVQAFFLLRLESNDQS